MMTSRLRCYLRLVLFVLLLSGGTAVRAQTCSATISSINFGSISPATTSLATVTGSVAVTCSGLVDLPMRVCINLGAGSGGSTYAPRLAASGANTLQYNLFSDSAYSTIWGNRTASYGPITVDIPLTALSTYTVNVPMYARVPSGQSTLLAGTYTSAFSGVSQAQMTYQAYLLSSPPSCSTMTANSSALSFSVTASVINDCSISASNVNFGTSGLLKSTITASGQLSVACTNSAPYSITLSAGSGTGATVASRRMTRTGGTEQVTYQLYQDSGFTKPWGDGTNGTSTLAGVGTGSGQSIPVYGRVLPQVTQPPGSYSDTVMATIAY
jgi:spore coat protein U-like protein